MADSTKPSVPNTKNRPLSPHLSIYRLPLTAAVMSIVHRATGVFLCAGVVLMVAWLWSAAYCPTTFEWLREHADSWWLRIPLILWSAALFYHFLNGIRHLGWDAGSGFSIEAAHRSGWIVLVGTALLTALVWYPRICPVATAQASEVSPAAETIVAPAETPTPAAAKGE